MTTDTALIYELALGEGDEYAALFANILSGADTALDDDAEGEFVVEEPDF